MRHLVLSWLGSLTGCFGFGVVLTPNDAGICVQRAKGPQTEVLIYANALAIIDLPAMRVRSFPWMLQRSNVNMTGPQGWGSVSPPSFVNAYNDPIVYDRSCPDILRSIALPSADADPLQLATILVYEVGTNKQLSAPQRLSVCCLHGAVGSEWNAN